MSTAPNTSAGTIAARLAAGLTDPAAVNIQSAGRAVAKLTAAERQAIAVHAVVEHARRLVRDRNLAIEVAAWEARRAEVEAEKEEERRASLFEGRYRHGSMDQRDGAVLMGCTCERCESARATEDRLARRFHERMGQIVRDFEADLKAQWTADLLASSFAVDTTGRTVTWAAATAEDHQTRMAMLTGNAAKNLEAAARHQAALSTLDETGTDCLADAVEILEARSGAAA